MLKHDFSNFPSDGDRPANAVISKKKIIIFHKSGILIIPDHECLHSPSPEMSESENVERGPDGGERDVGTVFGVRFDQVDLSFRVF